MNKKENMKENFVVLGIAILTLIMIIGINVNKNSNYTKIKEQKNIQEILIDIDK